MKRKIPVKKFRIEKEEGINRYMNFFVVIKRCYNDINTISSGGMCDSYFLLFIYAVLE